MKAKILLIDNYDSFVYNIARYAVQLGAICKVVRHDAISIKAVREFAPSHIIISPGPCTPDQAGVSLEVIESLYQEVPILGICLGHQAIGQVFGGEVKRALQPMHGEGSLITHAGKGLFVGIKGPCWVGRYHSLIVDETNLSMELEITARSLENEVMAFSHKFYPLHGVQFHPESIMTKDGYKIMCNFINVAFNGVG